MFSGGAFGNASIFALGVMPYISASIVIQLLAVIPSSSVSSVKVRVTKKNESVYTLPHNIDSLDQGPAYIANLNQLLRGICRYNR